jgi:predicted Rossmann-fold nucleotide-binding protein
MADMSDGFIALPGGIGTMEGFFEILHLGAAGDSPEAFGVAQRRPATSTS